MMIPKFLYVFISFVHIVALAQKIPAIKCPNYFQYLREGSEIFARITIPNSFIRTGVTKLDVTLSQINPVREPNIGKITFYESPDTAIARIRHGQPAYYRVTFPTQNEIPKLTAIAINSQTLCQDNPYPPPSTKIMLNHKIMTNENHIETPSTRQPLANAPSDIQPRISLVTKQQTFSNSTQVNNYLAAPSAQHGAQRSTLQSTTNSNFNCGHEGASRTLTPFIYGGKELVRGQFPWLTAIYIKRAEGLLYICVGSLVSMHSVITAAHCFEKTGLKANQILVVLGHHDLNSFTEEGDVKLELQSLHIHSEYNSNIGSDADVAVLHLKSSVRFTNYIQPVCLWLDSDDVNLIAGQKASVAGWGEDEQQHAVSAVPKVVEVDIAGDRECQEAIRSRNRGFFTRVRSICVSNANGDGPCRGDSGSGLIMKRNGRWTLRGIVSSGLIRAKRCYFSEFVYFCDLAKHASWLRANLV